MCKSNSIYTKGKKISLNIRQMQKYCRIKIILLFFFFFQISALLIQLFYLPHNSHNFNVSYDNFRIFIYLDNYIIRSYGIIVKIQRFKE